MDLKRAGTGAGLGLGLFIAKQIIGSHNGAVTVKSANGRTVFDVVLPRNANAQQRSSACQLSSPLHLPLPFASPSQTSRYRSGFTGHNQGVQGHA
ncbi:hypothetical protein [Caballeronia sp. S22]|uniref:hypothetical protein n=1 Tax=Caballeronia sp. S22 TaxID=3137182 RepID=UPI003530EC3D